MSVYSAVFNLFYRDSLAVRLHEKLDLHKFTRCKYDAKNCKLGVNQKQRW